MNHDNEAGIDGLSAERWWSVKLRVEEDELGQITGVPDPTLIEGMRHVRFGGFSGDDLDDPPSVTFELQAPDSTSAEERAQLVATQLRAAVKLPDALLPIVWLAPIGADDASSRFLDEALDLIHSERYAQPSSPLRFTLRFSCGSCSKRRLETIFPAGRRDCSRIEA